LSVSDHINGTNRPWWAEVIFTWGINGLIMIASNGINTSWVVIRVNTCDANMVGSP